MSFDVPVPEGKQIKSAILRLVSERGKDSSNEVSIYPYSHDFNEATATWTTESQYVSEALSNDPIESFIAKGHGQRAIYESSLPESHHALENWVNEVDVTPYAAAHEGGRINFLLSKEGANQVCFFTKENTAIDNGNNLSLYWTVDITASDLIPSLSVTIGDAAPSAIDSLEDADLNAPVEYYDLSGRRVANPDKGIYIMRQGTKAVKIVK